MPKISKPLTARAIQTAVLPPGQSVKKISDCGTGLVLEIRAHSQTWVYNYRVSGAQKKFTIGDYPRISLSDARESARGAKTLVEQGLDPTQEKKARLEAPKLADERSFARVFDRWFDIWKSGKTPRHAEYTRTRAQKDILPALGALGIDQITTPRILAMVRKVEHRGALDISKRVLNTTSQVCDYAAVEGLITANPCAPIKPSKHIKKHETQHMARVDAKELPELLRKIWAYDDGRGRTLTGLALRWMVFTFVRTSELINAEWSEIDWEKQVWRIPAARMKMRRPHIVPLSLQAIATLNEIRTLSGDGRFVFPGQNRSGTTMSNNTILYALYRLGYHSRMTGHGFRGLASTILHEQDWNHAWIELQLAHADADQVSAAYNAAQYLAGRTKMMQAWADFIDLQRGGANFILLLPRAA